MQITVEATTLPNYQGGGSTATLKIFVTEDFFSGGLEYVPGSGYFYQQVACTVSGTTVTIPSFTLISTTDSSTDAAKYVAVLYSSQGVKVATLMGGEEFSVPPYTPTAWQTLRVYNQATTRRLPDTYYTANQVELRLTETVLDGVLLAANNLSDVASASSARTNLGLTIGTNVQAWNSVLQTITENVSVANNGYTVSDSLNDMVKLTVSNSGSGTASEAIVSVEGDVTRLDLRNISSGFSLTGDQAIGDSIVDATGRLLINAGSAIVFGIGTYDERVRIGSGLSVGTTVDSGAGVVNVATGFRIGDAADLGSVLMGNGTDFVATSAASAAAVLLPSQGGNNGKVLTTNGTAASWTTSLSGFTLASPRISGAAPASAGDTGAAGQVALDADFIYVCTATNTWKRAAIATW